MLITTSITLSCVDIYSLNLLKYKLGLVRLPNLMVLLGLRAFNREQSSNRRDWLAKPIKNSKDILICVLFFTVLASSSFGSVW